MVWYIFAILGAILDAAHIALIKKKIKNINLYALSAGTFLISSIILLLLAIVRGIPKIGPFFYFSASATAALNIIATTLYLKALEKTDISLAVPMVSFTPVFLILTSFIILNEFPTKFGILGITLIVIGSYILNSSGESGILGPIKNISRNKGSVYMLAVAFIFSITSNLDKLVVQNSDQVFGSSIVFLLIGLSFLIMSSKNKNALSIYRKNIFTFVLLGAISALIAITINIAFTLEIVSYVISIKRLSLIFSVLLGYFIFKEKNILRRGIGALIMLLGVILIILL